MSLSKLIAIVLSAMLFSQTLVVAQEPTAAPPKPSAVQGVVDAAPSASGKLRILVLEGQNVVNSISAGSAVSPVVQVLDSQDQPVTGASVIFEVSATGPGGSFSGAPVAAVKTDYTGQATAIFTPNRTPGAFTIKVSAAMAGQTAQTRINQMNSVKAMEATIQQPPKPWYHKAKWWALIGAGATAGIVAAVVLKGGSSNTITISPGTPTIGGH